MIDLTLAEIADIVGGELSDITAEAAASTRVTGTVEFDSRAVTEGGLFLALPGARTDGHDFAAGAVAAGAVAGLLGAGIDRRCGSAGTGIGRRRNLDGRATRRLVAGRDLRQRVAGAHAHRTLFGLVGVLNRAGDRVHVFVDFRLRQTSDKHQAHRGKPCGGGATNG